MLWGECLEGMVSCYTYIGCIELYHRPKEGQWDSLGEVAEGTRRVLFGLLYIR